MSRTVAAAIAGAMRQSDPRAKLMAARAVARDWRLGRLAAVWDMPMPDEPGRPDAPMLVPPNEMPKRGRGGSAANRIALLHALAHIEFVAIDLALDAAGRFGASMPPGFTSDWLSVAADEALHFALLDRRLRALGSFYGALPAHGGLWEAARETAHDVSARLAVVPMVLEARGLDVTPATIARFEAHGDEASARILTRIYQDEIRHVGFGTDWFRAEATKRKLDAANEWRRLVAKHFRGTLKPPFNDWARGRSGLTQDFYKIIV